MSKKTNKLKNDPWKHIEPVIGSNYGVDEKGRIFKKKKVFKGPDRSEYIPKKSMSYPKMNKFGDIIHNNRKGTNSRGICSRMIIPQRVPVQVVLKAKDKKGEDVGIKVKLNKEKVIYHTRAYTG